MVQVYVPLWQASQQEYHPLVFSLEAWETHQVTVHTMEIAASEARPLPLGAHSPEIAPFPAGFLLMDLHPLRPSDFIFSVGEIWLSGFPGTEIRPRRRREPEETAHVNSVFLRKGRGTGLIVTLALERPRSLARIRDSLAATSEIIMQPPCFTGSKTRHKKGCHLPRVSDRSRAKPVAGTGEARATCSGPHCVSVFLLLPPAQSSDISLRWSWTARQGLDSWAHSCYLAGWRGALSLPTLSLFNVFFLYWGLRISLPRLSMHGWLCLTLSPSPFRCAHPLLTPPTPHPTPQCSLEEQFLFLPR